MRARPAQRLLLPFERVARNTSMLPRHALPFLRVQSIDRRLDPILSANKRWRQLQRPINVRQPGQILIVPRVRQPRQHVPICVRRSDVDRCARASLGRRRAELALAHTELPDAASATARRMCSSSSSSNNKMSRLSVPELAMHIEPKGCGLACPKPTRPIVHLLLGQKVIFRLGEALGKITRMAKVACRALGRRNSRSPRHFCRLLVHRPAFHLDGIQDFRREWRAVVLGRGQTGARFAHHSLRVRVLPVLAPQQKKLPEVTSALLDRVFVDELLQSGLERVGLLDRIDIQQQIDAHPFALARVAQARGANFLLIA